MFFVTIDQAREAASRARKLPASRFEALPNEIILDVTAGLALRGCLALAQTSRRLAHLADGHRAGEAALLREGLVWPSDIAYVPSGVFTHLLLSQGS